MLIMSLSMTADLIGIHSVNIPASRFIDILDIIENRRKVNFWKIVNYFQPHMIGFDSMIRDQMLPKF